MLTVPGCKDAARPREHERAKSLLSATHATIALGVELRPRNLACSGL